MLFSMHYKDPPHRATVWFILCLVFAAPAPLRRRELFTETRNLDDSIRSILSILRKAKHLPKNPKIILPIAYAQRYRTIWAASIAPAQTKCLVIHVWYGCRMHNYRHTPAQISLQYIFLIISPSWNRIAHGAAPQYFYTHRHSKYMLICGMLRYMKYRASYIYC